MIKGEANKFPSSRQFDYQSLLAQNGGIKEDKLKERLAKPGRYHHYLRHLQS